MKKEYYWFYYKTDDNIVNEIGILQKEKVIDNSLFGEGISYFPLDGTMESSYSDEHDWTANIDYTLEEATAADYNYVEYLFGKYLNEKRVTDDIRLWIMDHSGIEWIKEDIDGRVFLD